MPPDYLFKYTPLRAPSDEKRQKQLDDLLLAPHLWFAAPESFNDPMDCRPGFAFDGGTPEEREKFRQTVIKAKVKHDHPDAQGDHCRNLLEEYARQYPQFDESLCRMGHALLSKDLQNTVGVLCLSENDRDPVMFYHYAAGHTGMCLKFRSLDFFAFAEPVQYGMDYPVVDFFDDTDKQSQFERIFLTKYQGWEYEHEWRVINFRKDPAKRLTAYPIELLEGVIFGRLMSPEDRDYATNLLKQRGSPVTLYEAKLNDRHFLLDITMLGTI
ncbi:DUF2971 domain-containing protein [Paraburkholderia sp. J7]|uniref:DUF2971 domain-containing protein n=1 Tax=Paraburkholderia sp. J7 TaxID=2805438 RepID=UPI002AB61A89|nr:DUF2971 domain-containing protein [Paraburkholderia sp. J7]